MIGIGVDQDAKRLSSQGDATFHGSQEACL
jgi:hypothetical protein